MNITKMDSIFGGSADIPEAYRTSGGGSRFESMPLNPLCEAGVEIAPWQTFEEWSASLQRAAGIESLLMHLHHGFDIEGIVPSRQIARIRTYMAYANGWMCEDNFHALHDGKTTFVFTGHNRTDVPDRKTPFRLRQMVAKKAHSMLCLNPFCRDYVQIGAGVAYDRIRHLCELGYLAALMTFYCPYPCDATGYGKIANLPCKTSGPGEKDHNEKARALLIGLVDPLFCYPVKQNCNVSNIVRMARLWIIEVLEYLDKLHLLNSQVRRFSKAEAKKMHEIATRTRSGGQRIEDLKKLFALGNKAAVLHARWAALRDLLPA